MKNIRSGICLALFLAATLAADSTVQGGQDARLANLAMRGDQAGMRALLKQKVDVNVPQGDGMTALHWAAMKNDVPMAQMLLAAGANVKALTRVESLTPLALAAQNGHAAVIAVLLKGGSDPNLANDLGTTPLMLASASGDVDSVNALLAAGADVNSREKAHGQTAMMFAAGFNHGAVIRVLATHHPDLNAVSTIAKVEKPMLDEDGNPLPAAREGQKVQTARGGAVAEFMGGWSALHFAARDGYLEAVQALLESGADVNRLGDGDHTSALIMAIENGHFDLAKFLMEHGADVSRASDGGMSPAYAVIDCQWAPVAWAPVPDTTREKTSYMELLGILAERKADFNVALKTGLWYRPADHNQSWVRLPGSTPFWRAAQSNDLEAMKFLASHGADPKALSSQKDSALHVAAGVGWAGNFSTNAPGSFLPAVKYLVEDLGLDLNAQDAQGYTAVMGAAYRGDNEMVEYLVGKGAKLDFRTVRGWSVSDMANGPALRTSVPLAHPETIALLAKMGAPPLLKVEGEEILGIIKGKAPVLKQEENKSKDAAGKPDDKKQQ